MKELKNELVQRDARSLASGYNPAIRAMEIAAIVSFMALEAAVAYRLLTSPFAGPWLLGAALIVGFFAADFVSGFVHWLGDTWGTVDFPLLGKAFIRPFREHHVDEKAITRHDFVETNGNNCLISLPVALIALLMPVSAPWLLFVAASLASMIFWVMATNQFHKWSHEDAPGPVVAFLQRVHLILPPAHHQVHHTAPFNTYYCITVGWLNRPLAAIKFFPTLERAITRVTGLVPRREDIGESAARELFSKVEQMPAPVVTAAKGLAEDAKELLQKTAAAEPEAAPAPVRAR